MEYRNLEKLGLNVIDRKAIFDVYCTDAKGNNFIVEREPHSPKSKIMEEASLVMNMR